MLYVKSCGRRINSVYQQSPNTDFFSNPHGALHSIFEQRLPQPLCLVALVYRQSCQYKYGYRVWHIALDVACRLASSYSPSRKGVVGDHNIGLEHDVAACGTS